MTHELKVWSNLLHHNHSARVYLAKELPNLEADAPPELISALVRHSINLRKSCERCAAMVTKCQALLTKEAADEYEFGEDPDSEEILDRYTDADNEMSIDDLLAMYSHPENFHNRNARGTNGDGRLDRSGGNRP